MRFSHFYRSFRELRDRSPVETMGPGSRYALVSDLRLGDGGGDDAMVRHRDLLEVVLGAVYLREGHTLVLAGDTEDLRGFWSKDIASAWIRIYALFDEFASEGRLRKLLGERDLGLMRKQKPRYRLLHGLRLNWQGFEFFILHGHQAARYFAGMDYRDFLQRQLQKPRRIKDEGDMDDAGRLFRTERRLYRASRRLGIATIFGHTGRTLFGSRTEYDDLRDSVEGLLRKEATIEAKEGGLLDAMLALYRKELARMERHGQAPGITLRAGEAIPLAPSLFNPGIAGGRRGLNILEIEGGRIRMVRWVETGQVPRTLGAQSLSQDEFPEYGVARFVLRETSLASVAERSARPAKRGVDAGLAQD